MELSSFILFLFFFNSFIYYFIEKTLPSLLYFILSHSLAWWNMYLHDFFFYYKKLKHLFLLSRLKNIQLVVSFSYHNYYNLKPFTIYTAGHLGLEFYYPKILVQFSIFNINNMLQKTIGTCFYFKTCSAYYISDHLAAIAKFSHNITIEFSACIEYLLWSKKSDNSIHEKWDSLFLYFDLIFYVVY